MIGTSRRWSRGYVARSPRGSRHQALPNGRLPCPPGLARPVQSKRAPRRADRPGNDVPLFAGQNILQIKHFARSRQCGRLNPDRHDGAARPGLLNSRNQLLAGKPLLYVANLHRVAGPRNGRWHVLISGRKAVVVIFHSQTNIESWGSASERLSALWESMWHCWQRNRPVESRSVFHSFHCSSSRRTAFPPVEGQRTCPLCQIPFPRSLTRIRTRVGDGPLRLHMLQRLDSIGVFVKKF